MKPHEMDKLTAHFNKYFKQPDPTVLHMTVETTPHVDVLIYPPNEDYPFWKLVTMGASDFKMPKLQGAVSDRNEYIMFVDPSEDLTDKNVVNFYHNSLLEVAFYPPSSGKAITYGHSLEWEQAEDSDMIGAYIEFPQMIEDTGILRCKLGLMKTVACLQVVLITREETDKLLEIGPEQFSYFLYPEEGRPHFISERRRSDKF